MREPTIALADTGLDGLKYVHVGSTGQNRLITCRYAIRRFLSTPARLPPTMSSLSSSFPSSPSPPVHRIPIVTTTIFSPSATSHIQPANDGGPTIIPIGPIVGGCLAGIIIAVAAVVGWHLWGRSIKQKEEAKRKEAVRSLFACSPRLHLTTLSPQISHRTTGRNTRLNAFTSFQSSYTPSFRKHTQDRKVKFAVQTSTTQSDEINQLPALYHASLPARSSPLSQSAVTIGQPTVK